MKKQESKALQMQEKLNINIAAHQSAKPEINVYQSHIDNLKSVNEQRAKERLEQLTIPNIVKIYMELIVGFTFYKERTNEKNNKLYEAFFPLERYHFDARLCPNGFQQFDTNQDAPYFGVWVSKQHLCILTYCEGDITFCVCNDVEHYNSEIQDCIDFYGEGFEYKTIDLDNKESTTYRQERSKFLIEKDKLLPGND